MTWINRLLIFLFLILILISLIDKGYLLLALFLLKITGIYQIVSFLIVLTKIDSLQPKTVKLVKLYSKLLLAFLALIFLVGTRIVPDTSVVPKFSGISVITLAILWTYILELIKNNILHIPSILSTYLKQSIGYLA